VSIEMATAFVAATVPAKTVRVSGTTLFHVAMLQDGDALEWNAIAQLNGLIDPWITPLTAVLIPPVFPTNDAGGLLLVTPGGATAVPPNPVSTFGPDLTVSA
jgi:hypothetical protein